MQPLAGEGVEGRERLVEEQHPRPRHEGAGDRHALLLAAGQLPRPATAVLGEPDALQGVGDAGAALGPGQVGEAEADIAGHVEPGQQARLLEDDAHARMGRADRLAVDRDGARARVVEPRDQPEQGRLPAARAADQRDDLALLDRQVDARERLRAVRVGLGEVVDGQHGRLSAGVAWGSRRGAASRSAARVRAGAAVTGCPARYPATGSGGLSA